MPSTSTMGIPSPVSYTHLGLDDRLKREKTPFLFVGMVCVREEFQGQGYMRQVMDLAFREGDRLGVPVVLNTDAWSKCVKYQHLSLIHIWWETGSVSIPAPWW